MKKLESHISGQQAFLNSRLSSRKLQVKFMEDCRNVALSFAIALIENEVKKLA